MGILQVLFYFIFFRVLYASNKCQFSLCGNNSVLIRFPFQLVSDESPYCGYPGFNLICTNDSRTVLKLPNSSGEFYVREINYLTQQIQVYDPNDCLPQRLLSLDYSASPFISTYTRNYTFLNCSSQNAGSQFTPIDCLSDSTNFVSAIPSRNLANSLPKSCSVIKMLSVPVTRPERNDLNFIDDLIEDLQLTWDKPNCSNCESNQLTCGFESSTNHQIMCFSDYKAGSVNRELKVIRTVALCISGPILVLAILIASFVCCNDRITTISRNVSLRLSEPQSPASVTTTGLDESTIESYEKVVLGESRRVPGPNEETCWICLSEYNSKETVRCIPECKHCFHADCIDEWLRINTTCPVCRNCPVPSLNNLTIQ